MLHRKNAGFTLVEILIVVVIIGILAGLMLAQYNNVQFETRNTQRTDTLAKVARALELYHLDHNTYPPAGEPGEASSYYFQNMIEDYLEPGGYFNEEPVDAIFTEGFSEYKYGIDGVGGVCAEQFDRRKYLRVGLEGQQENQWIEGDCPGDVFTRYSSYNNSYAQYYYLDAVDEDGAALE